MGNGHVLREYSVEERVFGYRDSEIVREGVIWLLVREIFWGGLGGKTLRET